METRILPKKTLAWILCASLSALLGAGCAGVNKKRHDPSAPTAFKLVSQKTSKLKSGDYLMKIKLSPVGRQQIPMILVDAETQNGAIIKSLTISSQDLAMATASEAGVHSTVKVKDVRPQKISIHIVTDKHPGNIQIGITPYLASK